MVKDSKCWVSEEERKSMFCKGTAGTLRYLIQQCEELECTAKNKTIADEYVKW